MDPFSNRCEPVIAVVGDPRPSRSGCTAEAFHVGLTTAVWRSALIRHLDRQKGGRGSRHNGQDLGRGSGRSIVVIGNRDWGARTVGGAEPRNNIEETGGCGEG
jgi:hypothetical protein